MKAIHKNNVKWLLGLILSMGGMGLGSSCSDFLEVEPQNLITIDQFWNEENDVESVLLGCYSEMASYNILSRMMIWGEFRSENIVAYSSTIDKDKNLEKLLDENLTANNGYTEWASFYNVINRCNTVIDHAPAVHANDPSYTQSELNAHIAEAVALRSLCYFYLIRTFRDVPYNNETYYDDGQTLDIAASPFETVLDSLIFALESVAPNAIETYPKTVGLGYYNTGRITKWAIYSMLSEMYLWKEDYLNCIHYADLVIAHKREEAKKEDETVDYSYMYNYPLIWCGYSGNSNLYGAAFNSLFINGNSQESIFELNYEKGSGTTRLSNGPVSNFFGNGGRSPFCNASDYVLADMEATTPAVFSNKYDGRGYENLYYGESGEATRINKYTVMFGTSFQLAGSQSTPVSFTSAYTYFGSPYGTDGPDYNSLNKSNYILYRLTDVMLLEAEAYAQLMGDNGLQSKQDSAYRDSAFMLVDAVNRRSLYVPDTTSTSSYASYRLNKSDYITKLSMTNLVCEERERELMFEGKRWFDLVRRSRRDGNTSYMSSKVKQKSASKASIIESQLQKMDRIYWPYNLEELKVNKKLKQNSAFGSGENSSFEHTY